MNKQINEYSTGGLKENAGKPNLALVPYEAIARMAYRLEEGTKKYGTDNWKLGFPIRDAISASLRHLYQYMSGHTDEDHLAAAMVNIAFVTYWETHGIDVSEEDVSKRYLKEALAKVELVKGEDYGICNDSSEKYNESNTF